MLKPIIGPSSSFIHPYMDRSLSKKIRTFLGKMTYFYGQSLRKKAAILPTKPHTRLHLNHVVMTPVAQDQCGAPHVWNALPSQNPRQARGEERKMNGFSIC
jgi:hypothetical protein